MAERLTDAASYGKVRAFLEREGPGDRRLTAEWLAGRLGIPLRSCRQTLDQLTAEGQVRRHERGDEPPWYDLAPPLAGAGLRRIGLGALVLGGSAAVVVGGAMLQHVFYVVLGLGLGLMIAFAWLDWELRGRP